MSLHSNYMRILHAHQLYYIIHIWQTRCMYSNDVTKYSHLPSLVKMWECWQKWNFMIWMSRPVPSSFTFVRTNLLIFSILTHKQAIFHKISSIPSKICCYKVLTRYMITYMTWILMLWWSLYFSSFNWSSCFWKISLLMMQDMMIGIPVFPTFHDEPSQRRSLYVIALWFIFGESSLLFGDADPMRIIVEG